MMGVEPELINVNLRSHPTAQAVFYMLILPDA
jgi:hypothetical protein